MKECPCCKEVTDNFGVGKKLCRRCHPLKAKTRLQRFGYGNGGWNASKVTIIREPNKPPEYSKECPYCGSTFVCHNRGRVYCSSRCINAKNRKDYKVRYKLKYPDKHRAHRTIAKAVREGMIRRPLVCESCRMVCDTEAHHPDYSRPMYVYWWCSKCHHEYHSDHSPAAPESPLAVRGTVGGIQNMENCSV